MAELELFLNICLVPHFFIVFDIVASPFSLTEFCWWWSCHIFIVSLVCFLLCFLRHPFIPYIFFFLHSALQTHPSFVSHGSYLTLVVLQFPLDKLCLLSHTLFSKCQFWSSTPLPNIPCWSSVPPLVRTEVKMELYTLFPGERLVLQCLAQDETPIVGLGVIWTRDHAALLNGDRMRVNGGQLEIGSVEPADSGLYSCTVQSFLGNHSAYFIVNVTGTSCRSLERMGVGLGFISQKQFSLQITPFVSFLWYSW